MSPKKKTRRKGSAKPKRPSRAKKKSYTEKMDDIRPFVNFDFKRPDKVSTKNKAKITKAWKAVEANRSVGFELLPLKEPTFDAKALPVPRAPKPSASAKAWKEYDRKFRLYEKSIRAYNQAVDQFNADQESHEARVANTRSTFGQATIGEKETQAVQDGAFEGVWVPKGLVLDPDVELSWVNDRLVFSNIFEEGLDYLDIDAGEFAQGPEAYLRSLLKGQPPKSKWKIVTANSILKGRYTPKALIAEVLRLAQRYDVKGGIDHLKKFVVGLQRVRKRTKADRTKRLKARDARSAKAKAKRKRKPAPSKKKRR